MKGRHHFVSILTLIAVSRCRGLCVFVSVDFVFLSISVGKLTVRSTGMSLVRVCCSAFLKLSRFEDASHMAVESFHTSKNVLGEFICYSYSWFTNNLYFVIGEEVILVAFVF